MSGKAGSTASFLSSVARSGVKVSAEADELRAFAADDSGRRGATPIAIVRPSSTEQVQAIFKAAIASGLPLIPVSSRGGPRRRGDTVSGTPSVIVDLSGMTKLLHADGRDAIAIIEAGMTFAEFNAALQPHGLRAYQPLMPRASKSVLAAFLEREPTTVPGRHWDSTDPLATMELVFGEGELFRTGTAALPGTLESNLATGNRQMLGLGPVHLDFGRVLQGAQGSLGIVTWASIYCQRIPALEVPLVATSDTLEPLNALAYRLLRRRIDGQMFILNHVQLALMLARDAAHFAKLKAELPQWTLYFELTAPPYFPEEAIAYQRELADADAARIGVSITDAIGERPASDIAAIQRAYADQSPADRAGLAEQELLCVSQLDRVPAHLLAITALGEEDWAIHLQPMVHGVNAQCMFNLVGRPGRDLAAVVRRAAVAVADSGAFLSRPYYPYADVAFAHDPNIVSLLDRTKNLLDPNHVLQAGARSLGKAA